MNVFTVVTKRTKSQQLQICHPIHISTVKVENINKECSNLRRLCSTTVLLLIEASLCLIIARFVKPDLLLGQKVY